MIIPWFKKLKWEIAIHFRLKQSKHFICELKFKMETLAIIAPLYTYLHIAIKPSLFSKGQDTPPTFIYPASRSLDPVWHLTRSSGRCKPSWLDFCPGDMSLLMKLSFLLYWAIYSCQAVMTYPLTHLRNTVNPLLKNVSLVPPNSPEVLQGACWWSFHSPERSEPYSAHPWWTTIWNYGNFDLFSNCLWRQ